MKYEVERSTSFLRGVNDAGVPDEYRQDEVAKLINGKVSLQGGTVKARGGSWCPLSSAIATGYPLGAIEWELASGAKQVVVVDGGGNLEFSNDEGVTWTSGGTMSVASGPGTRLTFAVVREGSQNTLCIASGHTNAYQWDGSTLSTISGIPGGVKHLTTHGDRLIAAGHNGPVVAASKVGDVDDWTTASGGWTVQATSHDGDEEIVGLFELGGVILVFKRESVGYIEGFGYRTLQVESGTRGISRSVGCIASHSIAPLGNHGVMWLSERGFESYYIGGKVELESVNMQAFVDSIQMADIVKYGYSIPSAVWLSRQREYWCAVPVGLTAITDLQNVNGWVSNTYIFCFRPATDRSPAAMWLVTFPENEDFSTNFDNTPLGFGVDADGALCVVTDGTGQQARVGEDSALGIAEESEYGVGVYISNASLLGLGSAGMYSPGGVFDGDLLPHLLISIDYGGRLSRPAMLTPRSYLYYLDDPDITDDGRRLDSSVDARPFTMTLKTRPLLFKAQFNRKRLMRVSIQSAQGQAATIYVRPFGDGVAGTQKSIALSATSRQRADEGDCRPSVRGRVIDLEITTDDPVEIHAIEALADILRERL